LIEAAEALYTLNVAEVVIDTAVGYCPFPFGVVGQREDGVNLDKALDKVGLLHEFCFVAGNMVQLVEQDLNEGDPLHAGHHALEQRHLLVV
jgi:hypothetical protein